MNSSRSRRGFSLVELLIVMAVIALLSTLLLAAVRAVRSRSRQAACASNLHQLGAAATLAIDGNGGKLWRYYVQQPTGRMWWFGFEPGGPGFGTERPLQPELGPLGRYMPDAADRLLCPDFPYDDAQFFRKFAKPSSSYGFNIHLGPVTGRAVMREELDKPGDVFVLADAIHFDFGATFNEGAYVQYTPGASTASGYAHFRHGGEAQAVMLDGHVETQPPAGPSYRDVNGPAGNLTGRDDTRPQAIYGL